MLHGIPLTITGHRYSVVLLWRSVVASACLGVASMLVLYAMPQMESSLDVWMGFGFGPLATYLAYELLLRTEVHAVNLTV